MAKKSYLQDNSNKIFKLVSFEYIIVNLMQTQKHVFRIYERTLSNSNSSCIAKCLFFFLLFVFFYSFTTFVIGTIYILPSKNDYITRCFRLSAIQSNFKIQEDAIYLMYPESLGPVVLDIYKNKKQVIAENQHCTIIQGLNTSEFSGNHFEFTWTPNALHLTDDERYLYNFINYTIVLHSIPSAQYFFYGMDALLANQLIYNFQKVFPSGLSTKSSSVQISYPFPLGFTAKQKIIRILKPFFYCIVTSIATSLYIYATMIAAPALIIIFLRCTRFGNNGGNMTEVYKIFPWIGLPTLILETSQNPQIKACSKQICWAMILYFLLLYFVYYSIILQLANDMFYQKTEKGLQQMMFGFVALIQFLALIFMRTRPFIKYYPLTHTLMQTIFLIYCQFTLFGLKKNLMIVVASGSLCLFVYNVLVLQIPSQNRWNRTKKYIPTIDRPRIGFFPLFNMNWIKNLPDEWAMIFPLFGRKNFTNRELSFLDRNYETLNEVLEVNNRNNGQLGQQL